jgi:hypothetical protein
MSQGVLGFMLHGRGPEIPVAMPTSDDHSAVAAENSRVLGMDS